MKKIGFIDYYLDEWHANKYPQFFKKVAGDRMEVAYAYGEIDSPKGMTNKEWGEKNGVEIVDSIEKLIELSDYLIVLAPDNPETHLRLSDLALKSGKPVYIDKTFAPTLEEAKAIFDNADSHNTPCYSSSALFFSNELANARKDGVMKITSFCGGNYDNYLVHQVEQIITLMGWDVNRVMCIGNEVSPSLLIEFSGDRFAEANFYYDQLYSMFVAYDDKTAVKLEIQSSLWDNCIGTMANFFETGVIPVPHEQTLAVIAIIEAALKAKKTPFKWVEIK